MPCFFVAGCHGKWWGNGALRLPSSFIGFVSRLEAMDAWRHSQGARVGLAAIAPASAPAFLAASRRGVVDAAM